MCELGSQMDRAARGVERGKGKTHFAACMVPQVAPIHLELAMVVHVHQLVDKRVFHVALAEKPAGTKHDGAGFGTEPSRTRVVAWGTQNVGRRNSAARQAQMLQHKHHGGACIEKKTLLDDPRHRENAVDGVRQQHEL